MIPGGGQFCRDRHRIVHRTVSCFMTFGFGWIWLCHNDIISFEIVKERVRLLPFQTKVGGEWSTGGEWLRNTGPGSSHPILRHCDAFRLASLLWSPLLAILGIASHSSFSSTLLSLSCPRALSGFLLPAVSWLGPSGFHGSGYGSGSLLG